MSKDDSQNPSHLSPAEVSDKHGNSDDTVVSGRPVQVQSARPSKWSAILAYYWAQLLAVRILSTIHRVTASASPELRILLWLVIPAGVGLCTMALSALAFHASIGLALIHAGLATAACVALMVCPLLLGTEAGFSQAASRAVSRVDNARSAREQAAVMKQAKKAEAAERERRAANAVRHFYTKLVGVTFRNPNGENRQRIIERCKVREPLTFRHDEDNPADPNAVAVLRANGEQLGHLNRELAAEVVRKSERGFRYTAFITDLTGGDETRGVNILVVVAEPGVSDKQAQQYVSRNVVLDSGATHSPTQSRTKTAGVTCQQCGGQIVKRVRSTGNVTGIALALIVFLVGLVGSFIFPPISCFIGPVICFLALFMGGKREKIWKCRSCGFFFPRC